MLLLRPFIKGFQRSARRMDASFNRLELKATVFSDDETRYASGHVIMQFQ
jgi:hypothetical protein